MIIKGFHQEGNESCRQSRAPYALHHTRYVRGDGGPDKIKKFRKSRYGEGCSIFACAVKKRSERNERVNTLDGHSLFAMPAGVFKDILPIL